MRLWVKGRFSWMGRPQLMTGFLTLCLLASASSGLLKGFSTSSSYSWFAPEVKSAGAGPTAEPDCWAKPCMALTFDDGPDAIITPQILDILDRQQIKATFFLVGEHVAGREAIVQRQHLEGHEIGNHTWNHPHLTGLSPAQVEEQLRMTQQAIVKANVPAPQLMRPPYGAMDGMVAARTNLAVIRWNIDPEDWKIKDPVKIDEHLLINARPGGIILLHDTEPVTVAALEPALNILKQYYQFITASQLLRLSPGDQGQYSGR